MNLWRRFQQLAAPPTFLSIGTVVQADFGECTVQFLGGSTLRVQGAGTVGQSYFIRDGRLDGEAPTLNVLEMEV